MHRGFLRVAMLMFIVAAVALHAWREANAAAYFSHALRAAAAYETVVVGARTYHVDRGSVTLPDGTSVDGIAANEPLRLAYAKASLRRNPIMALPGTDPAAMRGAVERLESLQEEMAALQKSVEERDAVQDLYPVRFLEALATAEEARLAFLELGTGSSLSAALAAQRIALAEYRSALDKHERAFMRVVPRSDRRFAAGASSFSYASVLSTLAKLKLAAEATSTTLRARATCLRGIATACSAKDVVLPSTASTGTEEEGVGLAMARRVETAIRTRVITDLPHSRIYSIPKSECLGETLDPLFKVATTIPSANSASKVLVTYVGDLLFIDSAAHASVPFYAFLRDRGVQYVPTDPLLHYVCIDFWRDMADVHAMAAVSDFASSTPLSRRLGGAARRAAADIESSLSAVDVPIPQSAALRYADILREYATRPDAPREYRDSIESLLTNVRFASIRVSDAIRNIVEREEANMRILDHGVPVDLAASYVFFFRSGLPFMFMAHNPSVTGNDTVKTEKFPPTERDPYVYYSDIATTSETTQRVIRDIRVYRELHISRFDDLDSVFDSP
jgi:hypothetical protein